MDRSRLVRKWLIAVLVWGLAFSWAAAASGFEVELAPERPRQGGILMLTVRYPSPPRPGPCRGTVDGREAFFAWIDERTCQALVGLDVEMEPGRYEIELRLPGAAGSLLLWSGGFELGAGNFKEQHISVDRRFTERDAETTARIEREFKIRDRAYAEHTPERLWTQAFIAPVEGPITSEFGLRRFFNGAPSQPHNGVDFGVGRGTEVRAASRGRVALTGDFFFNGRFVYLDHGLGLFTAYLHLDRILVEDGELVERGRVIGTVGSTGRVTGPHLHWGARLWDSRIDPLELLLLEGSDQ